MSPTGEPDFKRHWILDPTIIFLNHGSFGACPRAVLDDQARWRERMEREPVLFLGRELESVLDEARHVLAHLVGAPPDDLAFVPNATTGVNTILRSLALEEGEEILVTDHEYNASRNALDYVAGLSRARIVIAPIPFPLRSSDEVVTSVLGRVSNRTRFLLIDHVTSPTGLVLPIERIIGPLRERGIETLVDGAHAPGMVPLDLERLGAAYYTGNCHKWLCTPKGSALLYVRRDLQSAVRPLVISHGASSPRTDRSRFRLEFDFTGTQDFSPFLSVPCAIRFLGSLLSGGISELMASNRNKALRARAPLCRALGIPQPAPEDMIGSLASFPLVPAAAEAHPKNPHYADALQEVLFERHRIEVPVMPWPRPPGRVLRIAAQIYNTDGEYEALARVLPAEVGDHRPSGG